MDYAQWLSERKKGIGSSDAAAVLSMSPWQTSLGVYLDKTGQSPDTVLNAAMEWGLRLEEPIAAKYVEATGRQVRKPEPIIRHPQHEWMLASLDRVADDGRNVELKTSGAYMLKEWGAEHEGADGIPENYLIQLQHQFAVTGREVADLAALLGGQDFRIYRDIRRNDKLIAEIVRLEGEFWAHVRDRRPPDPDWSNDSTLAMVMALYGRKDVEIELGDLDVMEWVQEYERLGEDERAAEKARKATKAKIMHAMQGAIKARLADGTLIKRKLIARDGYTVKPTEYEKLTIHNPNLKKQKARMAT